MRDETSCVATTTQQKGGKKTRRVQHESLPLLDAPGARPHEAMLSETSLLAAAPPAVRSESSPRYQCRRPRRMSDMRLGCRPFS
jgi:hypothetical protein